MASNYRAGADTERIVVEHRTGRLLGAQIVGGDGAAMRINACAVAVSK